MATQETQQIDQIVSSRRAMMLMGGVALAGLALAPSGKAQTSTAISDNDILNFALNLEYLEAQFYTLATSGQTIDQMGIGAGTSATGGGSVTTKNNNAYATCQVPFLSTTIQAYATETATEERKHVAFLRGVLGTNAVAQPNLDLVNSFAALGALIGVSGFDPFANDLDFLLGAYIFEDVGVSAYHGAAALIQDKTKVLPAAASILAVEAYHAGLIRTTLYGLDQGSIVIPGLPGTGAAALATKISGVRATLDGTASGTPDDIGLGQTTVALETSSTNIVAATIVNADANSIAWARTTTQVLDIVYASASSTATPPVAPTPGGFFPAGLNGNIK